jgi:hypothetical protein
MYAPDLSAKSGDNGRLRMDNESYHCKMAAAIGDEEDVPSDTICMVGGII